VLGILLQQHKKALMQEICTEEWGIAITTPKNVKVVLEMDNLKKLEKFGGAG
jgi:hypothetical protein